MTSDEFKKELFWTFNLNLTKEGEAKLDKLIERITKARIEQKHIYITGRPKVRPSITARGSSLASLTHAPVSSKDSSFLTSKSAVKTFKFVFIVDILA